jgi:hypothetical protein
MPKIYANRGLSNSTTLQSTPPMTCPFGELRVVNRTPIIDLKSTFGISLLRDNVIQTTGGTVVGSTTTNTGEFMLATTATKNSQAALQSNERGSYQSGYGMEVGIGMRISVAPPAGVVIRWGHFDTINGYYYQWDSVNKLSCNVLKNSVVTAQAVQSAFNTDVLDGTGPSGMTLDMTRGIIFHITFSWYGFGSIHFSMIVTDDLGNQQIVPIHQISVPYGTSTASPHQPVRVDMTNVSGNTAASNVYVGGRQMSIIGQFKPTTRITAVAQQSKNYNTTVTYMIAFRKKAAYLGFKVLMSGVDLAVPNNTFCFVNTMCTITGGTWVAPPSTLSTETAIEVNSNFSSVNAVGTQVFSALSGPYTTVGSIFDAVALTDNDIMVLSLQALGGVGTQTLNGLIIRLTELW